jgi:hypothetical protein
MIIDCDTCLVRDLECDDCVVTALLGAPPSGVELDGDEQAAIELLADSGLVAPLRLVPPEARPQEPLGAPPTRSGRRAAG